MCCNPDSALKYLRLSCNEDHQQVFRSSEKNTENLILYKEFKLLTEVSKAKDHIAFWFSGHAQPNITERSCKHSDRCFHVLCLSGKLMSCILAVYGHYSSFNQMVEGKQANKRNREETGNGNRETKNGLCDGDTCHTAGILDTIYFQAVKIHRGKEWCYLVSGKKASWTDTGKQSKTKTVLHQSIKEKAFLSQYQKLWQSRWTDAHKEHAVAAEIFTARELRHFFKLYIEGTMSAGIQRLGKHTISLSSSSFSSSKKRIALTLFTARSFQVSSDISFTRLSSAPHRGRLSVRIATCN